MKHESIAPGTLLSLTIEPLDSPQRIDVYLGNYFKAYSRSYFKNLLDQHAITLNGALVTKPSTLVHANDTLTIRFPESIPLYSDKDIPADLGVSILYENPDFLIIEKPGTITVHAPHTNFKEVTLVDWLLKHYEEIRKVGQEDRPGIVHRLDKETSGLLIIPRTTRAHGIFGDLFKDRGVHKTYLALVQGHPGKEGTIDLPISRDTVPIKMTHKNPHGKPAITHYTVLEYFDNAALVELKPVTGRTHQLRVHCAAIGHPIIGDPVYGTPSKLIQRQALHAHKIAFTFDGKEYSFTSELPADFKKAYEMLAAFHKKNS
jgi:23S rRNA pseudouridine1911/1915/1917 synthase